MKKFLSLLVTLVSFLMATQSWAIITTPLSNEKDILGNIKRYDRIFIKVKNHTGASLASGSVVVYDTSTNGDDGMGVILGSTLGDQSVACVVGEQAIAASSFGICQVYGLHQYVKFSPGRTSTVGFGTAGKFAFASSDTGYAVGLDQSVQNATHKPIGFFMDSNTGTVQTKVFLRLL